MQETTAQGFNSCTEAKLKTATGEVKDFLFGHSNEK